MGGVSWIMYYDGCFPEGRHCGSPVGVLQMEVHNGRKLLGPAPGCRPAPEPSLAYTDSSANVGPLQRRGQDVLDLGGLWSPDVPYSPLIVHCVKPGIEDVQVSAKEMVQLL